MFELGTTKQHTFQQSPYYLMFHQGDKTSLAPWMATRGAKGVLFWSQVVAIIT